MITGFAAVSLYAGTISYFDLQTRNATDLTIFMQALTSTVHGHPAPFYESFDCLTKSRCSFLIVHPSPVLYLAVPFYAVAPTPLTLFALQSIGVGLAAWPLFILTRTVTGSSDKGLVAAALYLLWAPTLSGEAFSFHLEAFLPLALFTVAMFWALGRYRLGLLAALVAFLVLEIAPVFAFFIGAMFLTYSAERVLDSVRAAWRRRGSDGSASTPMEAFRSALEDELRRRDVRYTLGLMASSAAAFVLLFSFMNVWGARLLGVASPPLSPGVGGIFYENSSPGTQSLGAILLGSQWHFTVAFWLILYALVAFVPLLAPRTWIIAAPWIGYTFLTDTTRFVEIGSQYTLVAAVPVFLGVAYGLGRVPLPALWSSARPAVPAAPPSALRAHWRRSTAYRRLWVSALVVVVATNLILLPVDPLLGDLGVTLSDPFQAEYQDHSLVVLPGFGAAEELAGSVPESATVTAPSQVFSLFANYPHAFVLLGSQSQNEWGALPFNVSGGPDDVVLYPTFLHSLSRNLSANLTNESRYGLEGWVGATTVGPLLLYARGATGPAVLYGPTLAPPTYDWFPSSGGLTPGSIGTVLPNESAPHGTELAGPPAANRSGVLGTTPSTFLPPGTYDVGVLAAARGANLTSSDHHSLLTVMVRGFGAPSQNVTFAAADLASGSWTELSFQLTSADPIPELELQAYFHAEGIVVAIAAVTIGPAAPG
jgi:uncharacterized membrane protein